MAQWLRGDPYKETNGAMVTRRPPRSLLTSILAHTRVDHGDCVAASANPGEAINTRAWFVSSLYGKAGVDVGFNKGVQGREQLHKLYPKRWLGQEEQLRHRCSSSVQSKREASVHIITVVSCFPFHEMRSVLLIKSIDMLTWQAGTSSACRGMTWRRT